MSNNASEQIQTVVDYIQGQTGLKPALALILGSGLGTLAAEVEAEAIIPYEDIPGFPVSTAPGHAGRLILGRLAGKPVVVMQGRFHFYEGYPIQTLALPIRVFNQLGASRLLVTNAAGGLNSDFTPGDIMLIADHINLMGTNPLLGPNDEAIGPRFSDMSEAYTLTLRELALQVARRENILLQQGVYIATTGPSFETSAERRYMRLIGGDAVGMSTVPEVIAANHVGMEVLGFSAITNVATGGADQPADDADEVLARANEIGTKLVRLVRGVVAELD